MAKGLAKTFHCGTEFTLAILDGKWKTVILCYLTERACRYSELRKLMPRLSDKVLTERLHDLTASGLVVRKQTPGVAGVVTYALTRKGKALEELLRQIYTWGIENAATFGVKVGEPLKALEAQQRPAKSPTCA